MSGLNIDQLLLTHQEAIAALRVAVPEIPVAPAGSTDWDDVWLLRWIMSFPDVSERNEALRKAIAWRAEHAALLAAPETPHLAAIGRFELSQFHGFTKHAEPVLYIRAGIAWPPEVMDRVTPEQLLEKLMHDRELAFRHCDAETRKQRVIVKMITVLDMNGVTLGSMDRRFFATLGASSKVAEYAYPQLLGKTAGVKPPSFFHSIFGFVSIFMSKKALAKFNLCPGPTVERPSASACPFASARFDLDTLPSFVGGNCHCTDKGGCVRCVPNEQNIPNLPAQVFDGEVVEVVGRWKC